MNHHIIITKAVIVISWVRERPGPVSFIFFVSLFASIELELHKSQKIFPGWLTVLNGCWGWEIMHSLAVSFLLVPCFVKCKKMYKTLLHKFLSTMYLWRNMNRFHELNELICCSICVYNDIRTHNRRTLAFWKWMKNFCQPFHSKVSKTYFFPRWLTSNE